MEQDLDELCIEAESIFNPFYFNQVSDDRFRSKVIDIIRKVVKRSGTGKIGRYNSSALRTVLFSSTTESARENPHINWIILATNYDEKRRRVSPRASSLEILLDILKDPAVVPIVFTNAIIIGLLNVCMNTMSEVKHGRGNTRTPSLTYIEDYIVQLLITRPICLTSECLGKFLCGNTKRLISRISQASSNVDGEVIFTSCGLLVAQDICNMIQRKISKDHTLSVTNINPISMITDNLMVLIRFVDDTLSELNHEEIHDSCVKCSKYYETNGNKRRKRMHTSSIHELHDEYSDDDDQKRLRSKYRCYPTQTSSGIVSLKSILAASSQNPLCETCSAKQQLTNSMTTARSIPANMSEFRPFLYNLFIGSVPKITSYSASNFEIMMRKCLRLVHQYPTSASIRLCLIIFMSHSGEKSYVRGLNVLLGYIQRSLLIKDADQTTWTKLVSHLNVYQEIVSECKVFDEPPSCWMATKPLLDLALSLDAKLVPVPLSTLLRCIGWLISKRLVTLTSAKTPNIALQFRQYSLKCSSRFGNSAFWFDDSIKDDDRKEIFIGLQRAGILSFADDSSQVDFTVRVNMCSNIQPYEVSHSSRVALSRSGLQMDSLFTNHTNVLEKIDSPKAQRQNPSRERDESLFSEPIMDYLNCDLVAYVFSYLGYKKLIHASMVCKLWKDVANENMIWKERYIRRFKPTFLYDYLPSNSSEHERDMFILKYCQYEKMDWKSLFRDKWLKERNSSKRRIGRQKLKCCTLIGCLTIVQQKKQDTLQHQLIHEKYCLKKLQVVRRLIQKRQKPSST